MKEKFRASGAHLIINLLIFATLLFVLLKLWYPHPYFTSSGGWQGLKIVALVDIVLGPVLTFVIFNSKKEKKLLQMDVMLICVLQVGAFIWGTWTVYQQRPLAITHWENSFYTVPARALNNQKNAIKKLKAFGGKFPIYAYVNRPTEVESIKQLIDKIAEHDGAPPYQILELYLPVEKNLESIFAQQVNIDEIITADEKMAKQLKQILDARNLKIDQLRYVKLESKYHNTVIVYNEEGQITGFLTAPYKDDSDV